MSVLHCSDGDLNGYGCLSSQFLDSLLYTPTPGAAGDPQWFNRLIRFQWGLELDLSGGTTKLTDDTIKTAITARQFTSCTLNSVTYTPDPTDSSVAYAEGELVIVSPAGSPIPSGTYKFKHTLAHVWRITDTKLMP